MVSYSFERIGKLLEERALRLAWLGYSFEYNWVQ